MATAQRLQVKRVHLYLIAALAFGLRCAFIIYTHSDSMVFNGWHWGDEGADIAVNLLQGKGYVMSYSVFTDAHSFRMPALPLLLFAIWSVFGYSLLLAKVLLAAVSSLTCVIVALLARRLFDDRVALIAGLLCAVMPGFIYWTATLGPETLATCCLVTGIYFLVGSEHRWRLLFAGLAIGLLVLTRPVFLPYAVIVALFLLVTAPAGKKLGWAMSFFLPLALLLLPWVIYNWRVHQALSVTSTEGGITFLETNNPIAFHQNDGEWVIGYSNVEGEVLEQAGRLRELELDRWMYRKGLEYVAQDPLAYARSFAYRVWYMWRPLPRLVAGGFSVRHVVVMLATWLPIFLLALWGVWQQRVWRQGSHILILLALVWITFAAGMIRGSIRYRAPLEPFVVLYAAAGLAMLFDRFIRRWSQSQIEKQLSV